MKQRLTYFFFFFSLCLFAQDTDTKPRGNFILTPEFLSGVTAEANENFPSHNPQFQALLNFGWEQKNNPQEWARRLKGPRTGITLGYTNLGNADSLGSAITLMPFVEFNAFKKKKLTIQVGMGGSYFTKKYDRETNPRNQAITTDVVWSFRSFMYYQIRSGEKLDWRAGIGYSHHSNGHTRLPNQGLNSFLLSLSADIKNPNAPVDPTLPDLDSYGRTAYDYVSIRGGYGVNVLSKPDPFNDKRGLYTISGEYGKVFNNTYKLGGGVYYRFYQHYYDYIVGNESLVQEGREFESLKENPRWNASNLGIFGTAEILMNHVGLETHIGINLHKPAYGIDWRINQGWSFVPREIPEDSNIVLGEYDGSFRLKELISARMGLKYYFLATRKKPIHNIYLGFHINTNGGQADFTDFSLGYVYNFKFRDR